MMKAFITGGAGFIGSNLADRLLTSGHAVTIYDNLSTGNLEFISSARRHERCHFIVGDLLDEVMLKKSMQGCDFVFHLAANADVRFGVNAPRRDLEQNTIATYNVLEAMRGNDIKRLAFSSTGSIYGENKMIPTPEDAPFPVQTSLYGASKLAGEGLIQAYCEGFGMQAWIFRFVSILGDRYTHGHVFDFVKRLLENPNELTVLGNGKQKKSYLHVQDCLDAIELAIVKAEDKINIFNLGTDEYCDISASAGWIIDEMKLQPTVKYSGGERGWIGDNPFIFLGTQKIRAAGWSSKVTIREAIIATVRYLLANKDLLYART